MENYGSEQMVRVRALAEKSRLSDVENIGSVKTLYWFVSRLLRTQSKTKAALMGLCAPLYFIKVNAYQFWVDMTDDKGAGRY